MKAVETRIETAIKEGTPITRRIYNVLISGYARHNKMTKAVAMFDTMKVRARMWCCCFIITIIIMIIIIII